MAKTTKTDEMNVKEVTEQKSKKIEYPVLEEGTLAAYLVRLEDGVHVTDLDGNDLGFCKVHPDGLTYMIVNNPSNRKWFNKKRADAIFDEGMQIELLYKATKHFSTGEGVKIPNDKLVKTYAPDLYDEYVAIINRAREAKAAEQARPKTELEKAQEKLARAQAALAKLQAQAAGVDETEEAE